jgi:hypothetical protein
MFTKLSHFEHAWQFESEGTLKMLRALTDASLAQAVAPEGRTLGRLAWHITTTLPEMMGPYGAEARGPRRARSPARDGGGDRGRLRGGRGVARASDPRELDRRDAAADGRHVRRHLEAQASR